MQQGCAICAVVKDLDFGMASTSALAPVKFVTFLPLHLLTEGCAVEATTIYRLYGNTAEGYQCKYARDFGRLAG